MTAVRIWVRISLQNGIGKTNKNLGLSLRFLFRRSNYYL
jgi:hypothetical protein